MKTAMAQYIEWLNTDSRRNHHHIFMAKQAMEYEKELLMEAFNLGFQTAIEKTKQIEQNESQKEG
jgi:hypothetical protein